MWLPASIFVVLEDSDGNYNFAGAYGQWPSSEPIQQIPMMGAAPNPVTRSINPDSRHPGGIGKWWAEVFITRHPRLQ